MDIYEFAKKEFAKHYNAKMIILVNESVKVGSVTKAKWVAKVTDQPCRMSKKQLNPTSTGEVASVADNTMLFCDPAVDIPAGCRISVTDVHGVTRDYKRSSEGFASHVTHQSVVVVREVKA